MKRVAPVDVLAIDRNPQRARLVGGDVHDVRAVEVRPADGFGQTGRPVDVLAVDRHPVGPGDSSDRP
jgi:hypothetical protein